MHALKPRMMNSSILLFEKGNIIWLGSIFLLLGKMRAHHLLPLDQYPVPLITPVPPLPLCREMTLDSCISLTWQERCRNIGELFFPLKYF